MRSATKIGCAALAALTCAGSAGAAVPAPPELPPVPELPPLPAPAPLPPVELPSVPSAPLPATPNPPVLTTESVQPLAPAASSERPAFLPLGGTDSRPTGDPSPTASAASPASSSANRHRDTSISSFGVRRTGRSIEIDYVLARRGRVAVILRGPVPLCTIVSRFSVQGKRGPNVLRFDGTVGRRRLETGTYLIGLRAAGSVRWKLLAVTDRAVRPVRRPAAPVVRACSAPADDRLLVASDIPADSRDPTARTGAPSSRENDPTPSVLPFAGVEDAVSELPGAAGAILLVLLFGSLAGIVAFVVRFLRTT